MSTDSKQTDVVFGAISQYQETVSRRQYEIGEENRVFRARVAPHYEAIDEAYAELDTELAKFFESASIDVFAQAETAVPLYRAGWNGGRILSAFTEGFRTLVEGQDTYLTPVRFGWTCHPADTQMKNPIMNLLVTLPSEIDESKLARTAEVAEKLFVPMTEVHAGQELYFDFDKWINRNIYVVKSKYEDSGYDVHSRNSVVVDFSGTMLDCLDYIARFIAMSDIRF